MIIDYNKSHEVILMDLNFIWEKTEIRKAIRLWNCGSTFKEICNHFKKYEEDEVFMLLLHLSRKGRIKNRKGFLWGDIKEEG